MLGNRVGVGFGLRRVARNLRALFLGGGRRCGIGRREESPRGFDGRGVCVLMNLLSDNLRKMRYIMYKNQVKDKTARITTG